MTSDSPETLLLDAREVQTLVSRAALICRQFEEGERLDETSDTRWILAAHAGLRLAGQVVGRLRDPKLASSMNTCVVFLSEADLYDNFFENEIAEAVGSFVARPLDERLVPLAEHEWPSIRVVLARRLSPKDPIGRRMLDILSRDPDTEIRRLARGRLAKASIEVGWWVGTFSHDPATESPDQLEAAKRIATLFNSADQPAPKSQLLEALSELNDELATNLGAQVMKMVSELQCPALIAILDRPVPRRALIPAFEELSFNAHEWSTALAQLSSAARLEISLEAARRSRARPESEYYDWSSSAYRLSLLTSTLFPPGHDLSELFPVAFEGWPAPPDDRHNFVLTNLRGPFRHEDANLSSIADQLTGIDWNDPGGEDIIKLLVGTAPAAVQRSLAQEAVESANEARIAWGLGVLLSLSKDPGTTRDLFERHRNLVYKHYELIRLVLPLAREELRAGRLDLTRAASVVFAQRKAAEAPPMDAVEVDELYRLRRAAAREKEVYWRDVFCWIRTVAGGDWHEDDKALLELAFQAAPETEGLPYTLAGVLQAHPLPNDQESFDRFSRLLRMAGPRERDLVLFSAESDAKARPGGLELIRAYRGLAGEEE
ncbi:MAG: hypothetical protein HY791_01915 [Deltaproteobacteria bacterium]|nr:hypothetical protein [Deltaproteobacteria bacterium]